MAGLWFEEFSVGQTFDHQLRRTVTETDNVMITTMTHNPAALHLDAEYMKGTNYGQVLVNSCFTLSLMVGISVHDTTLGTAAANLGWDEVRFPAPVFIGDTLRIESEVLELRESKSRPTQGIVTFAHRAYNQNDVLVASCKRASLQNKRPA
ncbi:MaoC family dehydratase [Aurantiacibacter sp. MUD61]|uniref:MaoC family dehydratase n=1 Tax=Aurantiacibacter sp. MUD61 TaxID=3009083 RepID=UPI0022F05336|nr:MaoC family dehydratase [Aurantiacibacter sp. MUD61]